MPATGVSIGVDRLLAALNHVPGPLTDKKALAEKSLDRLRRLRTRHPELDLQHWKESFRHMLES